LNWCVGGCKTVFLKYCLLRPEPSQEELTLFKLLLLIRDIGLLNNEITVPLLMKLFGSVCGGMIRVV